MAQTLVIWGAGRIGRGFVADLFADAGYHIIFVDQAEPLVQSLRERGQYTVVRTDGREWHERIISGFEVLSTAEEDSDAGAVAAATAGADLVAVAVFPKDFPAVAERLASGLLRRREERPEAALDIILCTNQPHAGPAFRKPLMAALPPHARAWAEEKVGVVESLVIRMVADPPAEALARAPQLAADPLLVWTNGHARFTVDRHAFRGEVPPVSTLQLVDDMRAAEARKLFTYNTFHAALAYLGALRGHVQVVDSLVDPWVRAGAEGALRESAAAVQVAYGFSEADMAAWIDGVLEQTDNAALGDTVARFGADPRRKLRCADRLFGPLLLARRHGLGVTQLTRAIAAALLYQDPADSGAAVVRQRVEAFGPADAVRALCYRAEAEVVEGIARAYNRLPVEALWAGYAAEAYRRAFDYEQTYQGGAQCVLAAVQDTTGQFDPAAFDGVFEAATGLTGGIALCGDGMCSAFTGGALALGLYSPRRRDRFHGDRENKHRAYDLIQRLRERFLSHYGGFQCCEVHQATFGQAYDLRDPAGLEAFEAAGAHVSKCSGVVAHAARMVVEIMGEEEAGREAESIYPERT